MFTMTIRHVRALRKRLNVKGVGLLGNGAALTAPGRNGLSRWEYRAVPGETRPQLRALRLSPNEKGEMVATHVWELPIDSTSPDDVASAAAMARRFQREADQGQEPRWSLLLNRMEVKQEWNRKRNAKSVSNAA